MQPRDYRMLKRRCRITGASLEGCLQELAAMEPARKEAEVQRLWMVARWQQPQQQALPTAEEMLREVEQDRQAVVALSGEGDRRLLGSGAGSWWSWTASW